MTRVLIFSDVAQIAWSRTAGPYRIATQLRREGYSTQVVEHFLWAACYRKQFLLDAIDRFVDRNTLMIGFSITFFQQTLLAPGVNGAIALGFEMDKSIIQQATAPYAIPLNDSFIFEIKEAALRKNPNIKFILGGASKNRLNLEGTPFDFQILGFADVSTPKFVKYLDGKNPFFQRNGQYIDGDQRAAGFSIDHANIKWEKNDIMIPGERVPIEISRGCIFNCKFCGYSMRGKKKLDYVKSSEALSEELIRNRDEFGITDYWFTDDTYNDTPAKLESIRDMLKAANLKIKFRTYLRLDLLAAHEHTVDILNETGMDMAMFGIESLNHSNTKLIGKGLPPNKVLSKLDDLWNKHGWKDNVFVLTCLMIGLPFDTADNLQWADTVLSDDFKSDYINLNPVHLTQTASELNESEFDKNPEKYGYTFQDHWNWTNSSGLTFKQSIEIVNATLARNSLKNQTGTLHEYHLAKTKQQIFSHAREIYDFSLPNERQKIGGFLIKERIRLMNEYFIELLKL
jgi:hypothetical protein